MKLSEVSVERGLDIIADIVVPIANIATDEKAVALFVKQKPKEGETVFQAVIRRLSDGFPVLIKSHKGDLLQILASLEGMTIDDYCDNKTFFEMVADLKDLLSDPEIEKLFPSAQTRQVETSSGSASTTTEDEV